MSRRNETPTINIPFLLHEPPGWKGNSDQTRTAVRENRVSRHHGGTIEGPLRAPVHHSTFILRGLSGALIWSSMMPIDASLSDSYRYDSCFISRPVAREGKEWNITNCIISISWWFFFFAGRYLWQEIFENILSCFPLHDCLADKPNK